MARSAIRLEAGPGPRAPTFEEELYRQVQAAPWWLASLGGHALVLLLLSVLSGGGGVQPARAEGITSEFQIPAIPLDPEVKPILLPTDPLDEPEATIEETELKVDTPIAEPTANEVSSDMPVDTDFRGEGIFDGPGDNSTLGVGDNAGGTPFGDRPRRRAISMVGEASKLSATEAGLEWLKNHQSPGGFWDCDGFEAMCKKNKCGGLGAPLFDPGVSGLALLAFLGTGETHRTTRYGHVVRNGLKYLKGVQDAEGCFGARTSNHFTYNHAIGALAMAEAYGLTQSPLFKSSAQNGINFVLQCQNPYLAWRYGVRPQDNDTSVTGWMVMALKSAALSGLDVDPAAFEGARAWMDKVTEPEYGRAGYTARGNGPARPQELMDRFPAEKSESLTAVAVLVRIFAGAKTDDEMVRKGADLCARSLPTWDESAGTIDYYYWYYGSLAMFQVGGEWWKRWDESLKKAVVDTQCLDGNDDRYGSWGAVDPWSSEGGRVYATAVNTMTLEVKYRYGKVFGLR